MRNGEQAENKVERESRIHELMNAAVKRVYSDRRTKGMRCYASGRLIDLLVELLLLALRRQRQLL
jgi:hypothetical protein